MFALHLQTFYEIKCWRGDVCIWTERFHNLVTTVGRNKILDATFKDGIGATAWFIGLVDNAGWSAYAAADTMASHTGWAEGTPYSDATRQPYVPVAAASASQNNTANPAFFTINATLTVRGAFMTDVSTKGGATGTLYGVGDFTLARSVISGDVLRVTITLTD